MLKIVIDAIKICRSECESFFSECRSILNTTDASSFLPDCSAYSSTNCSHFDFIPPLGLLESSPFLYYSLHYSSLMTLLNKCRS